MNLLTYSSLYPNPVNPSHGIFVERRLRHLLQTGDIRASVVAPVPWFPFRSAVFGEYASFARIPSRTSRFGIDIRYPRFRLVPKFGMLSAPRNMAKGTLATVADIQATSGPIDVIDAHYFYPDGVAASRIAERLGIPFIVTARGSDINVIGAMEKPRQMILEAAGKAMSIVAVSEALKRAIVKLGVREDKVQVLRNGVDLDFFCPGDRLAARQQVGFTGTAFISVGALKKAKGHDIAIRALSQLNDAELTIIGGGPYERSLRQLADDLGLQSRVHFTGRLDAENVLPYYQAADALFLVSEREGMPNVVLESVACGTPVIAADVGGIREVVSRPAMGELVDQRTPERVVDAWQAIQRRGIDRRAVRVEAERYSWEPTVAGLRDLFGGCIARHGH